MLLQLAMDKPFNVTTFHQLAEALPYVDILEVGTPVVYQKGMSIVHLLKKNFPDKTLLADLKIADAGQYETEIALEAGADIVTVLAGASDATIAAAVKAAHAVGAKIAADLIDAAEPISRAQKLENMGVDIICAHTGLDMQQANGAPFSLCNALKGVLKSAKLSIAGGISPHTLAPVIDLQPDIMVVGSAITSRDNLLDGVLAIWRDLDALKNDF